MTTTVTLWLLLVGLAGLTLSAWAILGMGDRSDRPESLPETIEVHPCERERSMPLPRWVFKHERYWTCPTCGAEWYIAGSGGEWDGWWHSGYWKRLTTGRIMSPPMTPIIPAPQPKED